MNYKKLNKSETIIISDILHSIRYIKTKRNSCDPYRKIHFITVHLKGTLLDIEIDVTCLSEVWGEMPFVIGTEYIPNPHPD